ncbi:MAG: RloB domain-containing protein [Prevotella sp.]|nr:RloB domain-containing protein [Prevotella sp.]
MRHSEHLQPDYSICIICEGEKTEPYFYGDLIAWMERERWPLDYQYRIFPVPASREESDSDAKGRQSARRQLENMPTETDEVIMRGPMPECWVDSGIAQLKNFSEVWVVFDKDEHPHHKEAFEKVRRERAIHGNLNLAFSSRCFEMYLLQHFEYNTQAFLKSECDGKINGKTRYFNCCQANAIHGKACDGDKCINGYARSHGYWQNSKSGQTFSFIRNLWYGIFNSHRLKWHSLATLPQETEVYERNPYLDSYRLTLRLMGYRSLEHGNTFYYKVGNDEFHLLKRMGNTITFMNKSRIAMKIPAGSISIMKAFTGSKPQINVEMQIKDNLEEIEVKPNSEHSIPLTDLLQRDDYYLKISWNDNIYFCAREDGIDRNFDMSKFNLSSC